MTYTRSTKAVTPPARTLRRLLFSLVPLVVLLGSVELLLRWLDWPSVAPGTSFEHNEPYWITDPDLHDQPFPHREVGGTFLVSTDHQGLRAPIHGLDKPPGVQRLLFLGCSTTFGWGVNDDETYPAVLESLLHRDGHREIQVINGGQPGHTSFQGLWLYKNVARRYSPDVVFFTYVVQDSRKAAYTDRSQALISRDARFLKDHLLYHWRGYLALRFLVDEYRLRSKERPETDSASVYRVPEAEYVANIREMLDLTRQDGARLVLFGFPLEREGYTRNHRRILRIAAQELDLPYLDLQPYMEQLSRQETLYFPQDRGHANARGHAVIAGRIYEFLQDSSLLAGLEGGDRN